MTIKEVSEKYDISQDTLRYYERIGMLPPVKRVTKPFRQDFSFWLSKEKIYSTKWNK